MTNTKTCNKCKKELTIDNFAINKSGKNGVKAQCKGCLNQHAKQYSQNNKVNIAKRNKKYQQDNKKTLAEYQKKYQQDNKEDVAEYKKQYRQEHLEEFRVYSQKRRARKHLLPSTLTTEQWTNIKKTFNNSCAYCGQELPLAQEHVVPLSKGGEYAISNIICVCGSCNSSKGAKLLSDWYPKQECYSKKREQKILKHLGYKNEIQQLQLII